MKCIVTERLIVRFHHPRSWGEWWRWLGQGGHGLLVVSGWSQWPLARLYFTLGARDIYDGYNKIYYCLKIYLDIPAYNFLRMAQCEYDI